MKLGRGHKDHKGQTPVPYDLCANNPISHIGPSPYACEIYFVASSTGHTKQGGSRAGAGGGVTTLDVSCVWWRGAAYCAGLLGAVCTVYCVM